MKIRSYILALLFCFTGLAAFSQNIEFIENKGQWDKSVRFMGPVSNGAFFIHDNGFTVLQHHAGDMEQLHESSHKRGQRGTGTDLIVRSHAYRVSFMNARTGARIEPDKMLSSYNNYFIGNDPSKWGSHCRIYQGITIKDIYPNIDVRYYSDRGTLKYDIIVRPGGNVADIALNYEGADKLSLKNRELIISTSVGDLKELAPYTYQYSEKGKAEIKAAYALKENTVRFNVRDYNRNEVLIIDPTLIFCSFTGSTVDNWGFTATYGPDGSMYGGGIVFGGGLPTSPGAFQTNYGGGAAGCFVNGFDIGIMKLTPDGSNRVYATYIGGSSNEMPQSLIVDPQGNLIIAGRTDSPLSPSVGSYPVKGAVGQLVNNSSGSWDIIVTKLNAAGDDIIASVRVGGSGDDGANISPCGAPTTGLSLQRNYGDESRSEVNIDAAGNIYLSSCTQSLNFPTVAAFQPAFGGGLQDGLVMKFDPSLSVINFSSYFGGAANDAAYVLSLAPNGNIYIAGGTESPSFTFNTAGTIGTSNQGAADGFVAIIANNGSAVLSATFLGTPAIDQIYGIQFDDKGFPYVMGQTLGNWPVQPANVWSQANGRQFIAKLQPDLSGYVYSTKFGKGDAAPDISPVAFLVDRCENVYVSGWGGRVADNYPNAGVQGLPVTPDAIKSSPDINPATGLGEDFYFFVLRKDAVSQLFGSYFGKNGGPYGDHVDGGTSRFDRDGVIYQAICASCGGPGGLPFTTPGVWAVNKPNSANCNMAMVKIAFNLAGVSSGVQSFIDGVPRDTAGCVPLTVDFRDSVLAAVSYEWNFGDGSPQITTSTPDASHTYLTVGTFQVMLVAIDSTTCNIRDTSYMNIFVGANEALLDFDPVKLNPCDSFKYRFDNLSVPPAGFPFKPTTFTWDFGDGSAPITTGPGSVFHSYLTPGTYTVKLYLRDSAYCNSPDSIVKQVRVAAMVKARFDSIPQGCAPFEVQFDNTSDAGNQFIWDFGDNSPLSNDPNPVHIYTNPGTYTVTLIAIDSGTCNITDTTRMTFSVFDNPVADFSVAPQPPSVNTPISFTNLSSPDAVSFKWLFGDGDSLITTTRNVIQHEYVATGTYNACLIAYNQNGCADTACRPVQALIDAAVDVPNAFTPGQSGVNSVVYVRGFGIAKMKFTVYARWGEKVFESTSKNVGWNGWHKGKLLPMDVYAYTLDVEFSDGTKTTKTGDITLIR